MANGKKSSGKKESAVTVKKEGKGEIQRRNPYELLDELDRWFTDDWRGRWPRLFGGRWPVWPEMKGSWAERSPKVDVADGDKEVVIKAELPGVGKDDLDVSLTDAGIRISAKTHAEKEIKDDDYVRREISHGEFSRVIALPAAVDGDKVEASFKDGVLTVKLPKMESSQRRPIKVS